MQLKFSFALLLLIVPIGIFAQSPQPDPYQNDAGNRILNFQFNYTLQFPEGDLSNRFGNLHQVGGGLLYKSRKHWVATAQISYQFGYTVKEPGLFYYLTNSSGYITNSAGNPATYFLGQRGLNAMISGGRIFPFSKLNRNSGLLILVGTGYMLHKINIAVPGNDIPAFSETLKRGYDRLTAGFALSQFVGYSFQSRNRFVNFYVGFDFCQGFTRSLRGYNYDQQLADNNMRFDAWNGLRFGWMIPLYLTSGDEDEFDFK